MILYDFPVAYFKNATSMLFQKSPFHLACSRIADLHGLIQEGSVMVMGPNKPSPVTIWHGKSSK